MAYQTRGFLLPAVSAGADLSTHQFKLVKLDANSQVILCGAGENCAGALENDPVQDQAASVVNSGVAKVIAAAGITAGANVASDAAGLAVTAVSDDFIAGRAMTTVGAGEYCSVLLDHPGVEI